MTTDRPATPLTWRIGIAAAVLLIGGVAFLTRDFIGPRGQAVAGVLCFFGLVANEGFGLTCVR
ncbi:MAG: hypothetical protein QM813_28145 [Verrucomicrobiota bacterium]